MAKKKLHRSKDKIIAGVCSGIADYANLDPTVVRALYVIVTVFTGLAPGVIAYVILWLIMPEK